MTQFGLIILAILASAFLGLSFHKRSWGVAIFCAVLPAYLIRYVIAVPLPGLPHLPTTFLETLFLILFLPWLIERGFKAEAWRGLKRWQMPLVLIAISSTVGVLVSPDLIAGLGLWRAYFLEPILFFALFTDTISTAEERRPVLIGLGCTLAVIALTAVFQKITGYGIPNPIWQAAATRRVTSFFGYPNAIGLFAAPLTVLFTAWSTALFHRDWKSRYWSLMTAGVAVLGFLACTFAVSKGALLGIIAGVVVYGLAVKKLRPAALILIIISCIAVLAYGPLFQKATSIFSLSDDSSSVRVIVWDETFRMLADRPIFGAGLSGYQPALAPYHLAKHIEIFMYPHNILLNFWSELGLIGLAGFIWLIILFFVRNARLHHAGMGWLPLGLLAAMTAVVVHGFVDVPYFKNDLAFLFWIMFGLSESLLLRADHPGFWEAVRQKLHLAGRDGKLDESKEA